MLEKIQKPNDIKKIPADQLPALAEEIREFIIESLSKTGGHLASNLGVVELTIAMHRVFDLPKDKLIWDVGHQSYTHKILTGRKDGFETLRREGGISGFPKRSESDCDVFDTGHSSTSISAGVGYVRARELKKENYSVVSIIGDGALTGGMAYEALNNAASLKSNFIIVLNDNEMSITENVGGMSSYLSGLRTASAYTDFKMDVTKALNRIPGIGPGMVDAMRKTKSSIKQIIIPGMLFEDMGLTYLGPVDGHNIPQLIKIFQEAKRFEGPILVHVLTQKGRGYEPAMRHPARFHGAGPFDVKTGLPVGKSNPTYTDVFSTVMRKMGDRRKDVAAVTAAMMTGVGLKRFSNMFPDRCFDVGIAEEHAVTFAAALSLGGITPVVAIYSSFLQRAYDQIMHDVCMQNLHVVFAIDRAGLVGYDGETHHGIFDLSYLGSMPNMTILAPKNLWELSDMIKFAVDYDGPIAVRYPRGEAYTGLKEFRAPICLGKSEVIHEGSRVALLAVGSMVKMAEEVQKQLKERMDMDAALVNARFVKPIDEELLRSFADTYELVVTLEENVKDGGFGERVLAFAEEEDLPFGVEIIALPDRFIPHGSVSYQMKQVGFTPEDICGRIEEYYRKQGQEER
ncbi:1-deoxy-D-xylulose-5-phosphate synthase [Blautia sp. OM06-15AC]|jgi:1-deoxy-D-xylulose-5-phosphate synthase|uniref:1-deoxy-D-xylulose-5-phosphate synthase n=1 Tax=Blautia sp. OM06-15AC TaxID=2292984 RepID=UPI00095DA384|nr:1-deoxy-D-xylulose-5-phosphate synthase [Blautia sp. OM06-15AC]MBS6708395.1 1-deoxy-D-xylulose-5-phosphate synthase [Blautia sp.]OKZ51449.1 MAG: 1-deoxy-D-xylulose-5-phosphate synthase [Blautia sp. CAG:37_48_57]RHV14812.1 1-deoxy-D-xylulose-5-phosphate synthase [Blautia sp. OM06-15AC]